MQLDNEGIYRRRLFQALNIYEYNFNMNISEKKSVSVLGDSVSTLEGYNPQGYNVFYSGEALFESGIRGAEDTWWGYVTEKLGGGLLVNDSFSGSLACDPLHAKPQFPSSACDYRIGNLGKNGVSPDIIMIYTGTNDSGYGVPVYGEEADGARSFCGAYGMMLEKIKHSYPFSAVLCFTLMAPDVGKGTPERILRLEKYNECIRKLCPAHGATVIDIAVDKKPYSSFDGLHPDADGMKTIARSAVMRMKALGLLS